MPERPAAWSIVAMVWPFGLAYALSYALRTIHAVLSPAFVDELGLSAGFLGLLTSAYLLAFAAMQLPVGLLLDRYGPRRVEGSLLVLACLGCAISALAETFWLLWVGRALIGVGVSACLMASYKAYRLALPEGLQAPLASTMLVIGSFGALCATLPVEWALGLMTWREIFWLLSACFALAWAAIVFALPALPQPTRSTQRLLDDARDGLLTVMGHPEFRRLMPFGLITYGGLLAMHGLWMGPWFRVVESQTPAQAAVGIFIITATVMGSHLLTAWLASRAIAWGWSLERLMRAGLMTMAAMSALAVLGVWPHPWVGWMLVFLTGGTTTLSYTRFAQSFPDRLSGRATTSFNFLIFLGAFAVQWGIGLFIDGFEALGLKPMEAMRAGVGVWVAGQVAALLWLIRPAGQQGGPRRAAS